ncbi:MAG: N-formylglutamate amidohydrolase [Candidatus Omnitrophota bacterium]
MNRTHQRSARPWWTLLRGDDPVVVTALHSGDIVDPEFRRHQKLTKEERKYEEDLYTDKIADIGPNKLIVHRSRFEVDFNRAPDECIYSGPEQAWGLEIWRDLLPAAAEDKARHMYHAFYREMNAVITDLIERFGHFLILDIHSFNTRSKGAEAPAGRDKAPDINVGTGTLKDPQRWRPLIDRLISVLRRRQLPGCRNLDVRENVNFQGGYFPEWVHEHFTGKGCVLALEIKKIYMDEWTLDPDPVKVCALRRILSEIIPLCRRELERI